MSIFPRKVDKLKDRKVRLHMKIVNNENKSIKGKSVFLIFSPSKRVKKLYRLISLNGKSEKNIYFYYPITKKTPSGKYVVKAYVQLEKFKIYSDTADKDFFYVT